MANRANGIISLGGELNEDGDEVTHLRALDIQDHFFRSKTTAEVLPRPVLFSEINNSHIGMYVEVANVRFAAAEQGKPFVDPKDYYDTQRTGPLGRRVWEVLRRFGGYWGEFVWEFAWTFSEGNTSSLRSCKTT